MKKREFRSDEERTEYEQARREAMALAARRDHSENYTPPRARVRTDVFEGDDLLLNDNAWSDHVAKTFSPKGRGHA